MAKVLSQKKLQYVEKATETHQLTYETSLINCCLEISFLFVECVCSITVHIIMNKKTLGKVTRLLPLAVHIVTLFEEELQNML